MVLIWMRNACSVYEYTYVACSAPAQHIHTCTYTLINRWLFVLVRKVRNKERKRTVDIGHINPSALVSLLLFPYARFVVPASNSTCATQLPALFGETIHGRSECCDHDGGEDGTAHKSQANVPFSLVRGSGKTLATFFHCDCNWEPFCPSPTSIRKTTRFNSR